jgi:hypothetical protein
MGGNRTLTAAPPMGLDAAGEATHSGAQPMVPQPDETRLTGRWIYDSGKVRGDATCDRITWLVASHLQKLATDPKSGGWETLFRDPGDDRYWELTYPQGELHGGGPPQLLCLSEDAARRKYQLAIP